MTIDVDDDVRLLATGLLLNWLVDDKFNSFELLLLLFLSKQSKQSQTF
jgi:hypothetical protein